MSEYAVKMREERDKLFAHNEVLQAENDSLKRKVAHLEGWTKIMDGLIKATCKKVDRETAQATNRYYQSNDEYYLYPEGFSPTEALLKG